MSSLETIPTLVATRGISGSGKSTWAKQWVEQDAENRRRVNRDDIRLAGNVITGEGEKAITDYQRAMVRVHLSAGRSVVVDDTNLRLKSLRELYYITLEMNSEFEVKDFNISLEDALANNAKRAANGGADVPTEVITNMFEKFTRKGALTPLPEFTPPVPKEKVVYRPDISLPKAFIFDVDGTLTIAPEKPSERDIYDESRVYEDSPNIPVVNMAKILKSAGFRIIVTSARSEACRELTENWLNEVAELDYDALFLRTIEERDARVKDNVVKLRLFNENIKDHYNVCGVYDDRNQVVNLWRSLGLTTYQVADGNF